MKCLTIDEMLDVLDELQHPAFATLKVMAETVADQCAAAISDVVPGIGVGKASYEGSAFAGTCATFWAEKPETCPLVLRDFDPGEWTDADGRNLDPDTGAVL